MINRRAMIAAGLCVGTAVLAQQLKPHRRVSLLKAANLDDLVPRSFGAWTSQDVGDPLALNAPGTLSAKLYNQLVTRAYSNGKGAHILMLLAHGDTQSDELQLHRPEICYPAFGYKVVRNDATQLAFGPAHVPARSLVVQSSNDREQVFYWTRLGEFFPQSTADQRHARFSNTLAGIIPDGVLCRFSMLDAADASSTLADFLDQFIVATGGHGRQVLIGVERSKQLGQSV